MLDNLQKRLKNFCPIKTASIFSALILNPKYHYHQFSLEMAIKYSLSFCKGQSIPTTEVIKKIFDEIYNIYSHYEDPIEDVFISKIRFNQKTYKIQLGLYEGGIHSTQLALNTLELLPNERFFLAIKEKVKSILQVSTNIIEKNDLECNKLLNIDPINKIDVQDLLNIEELINKVQTFNENFTLPLLEKESFDIIFHESQKNLILEEKPFFSQDNNIYFLLPTAITITVRKLILEFFIINNKKDIFVKYYEQMLSEELYKTRIFGKFNKAPVQFYNKEGISAFRFAENVLEFDKNHFFHFIFLLDTLGNIEEDWFDGFISDNNNVSDFINNRIKDAKRDILCKDIDNKGCSFIVFCGIGRGVVLPLEFKQDSQWFCESISNHDLITISNDLDCSPNLIWRIVEAQYKLEQNGTQLLNLNGFLNLYGYVKDNNFSILVNESFNEAINIQPFSTISLGNDYNAYIREKVALDTDYQEIENIHGKRIVVRRGFPSSLFSTNIKYNLYVPENFNQKTFIAVYINYGYKIWLTQEIKEKYDFTLQYKLFDALITWFSKIVAILNKHHININKDLKMWNIEYSFVEDISYLNRDIDKDDIYTSFVNRNNKSILHTNFNINLLKGFLFEKNYSEQTMIIAFLNYLGLKEQDIKSLLLEIIVNEDARLLHFFKAHKYREQFDISDKKPITFHQIDEQIIKLNLGWSSRTREEGNIIEGVIECNQYLNSLLEAVWKRLQSKLKTIERADLIKKLLLNYEYTDKEKEVWGDTFKSNLALQEDRNNLYQVAIDTISQYNANLLSSRIVIEMAICECSVNCGKETSKLDIQELLSLASFMNLIGSLSEAIKYEAIAPKIVISSFGDILFDLSFNDMIMDKFGFITNQKLLDYQTTQYDEKFQEKTYIKETNHLFEKEFLEAYIEEFNYTLDDARLFLDFLEDYGMKIDQLVYSISYNDLIEEFDVNSKDIFIRVLDSLIIRTRRDWTNIPKPFKSTDWQPWKFRRRYSMAMKPIVEIDSFERILVISPQIVRMAYFNLTRNIHEGYLEANQFQSKKMQNWIGSLVHKNGLLFNSKVKDKLIELGLEAREEIKLTEIFNKKLKNFGDIDVFAWCKKKNRVYAIECKDLWTAKNQSEIARQLYEFKGQIRQINGKDKKDRLYKHYLRFEELKKDLEAIRRFTGVNEGFELKAFVVFSNMVPMNFDDKRNFINEIPFLSYEEIENIF